MVSRIQLKKGDISKLNYARTLVGSINYQVQLKDSIGTLSGQVCELLKL